MFVSYSQAQRITESSQNPHVYSLDESLVFWIGAYGISVRKLQIGAKILEKIEITKNAFQ